MMIVDNRSTLIVMLDCGRLKHHGGSGPYDQQICSGSYGSSYAAYMRVHELFWATISPISSSRAALPTALITCNTTTTTF